MTKYLRDSNSYPAPGTAECYWVGSYEPSAVPSGFETSEEELARVDSAMIEDFKPGLLPGSTSKGSVVFGIGRRVDPKYFPSKVVKVNSRRALSDFEQGFGRLRMVSPEFRDLVEAFQPGVHQFQPFEMYWPDGKLIGTRYFFVVCRAIDSVDQAQSTLQRVDKFSEYYKTQMRGYWEPVVRPDGEKVRKYVFKCEVVAGETFWVDEYVANSWFCSDAFIEAFVKAGLIGMGWTPCETS